MTGGGRPASARRARAKLRFMVKAGAARQASGAAFLVDHMLGDWVMAHKPATNRRLIMAGIIGNVMEWYDFAVYGYFAIVIGKLFFPSDDPSVSLIAAYGAFAAGFLARPIGGLLLGRLGDLIGRRHVLIVSILCMALPTFLMGALPTQAEIGIMAPLLLVLLRIIQGLSVGGEFTSSSVFLAERAQAGQRGLLTSWSIWGAVLGILLGSLVGTLLTGTLDDQQILRWGWRVPFLIGPLLALLGLILRRGLLDEPGQGVEPGDSAAQGAARPKAPLVSLLTENFPDVLRIVCLNIANGVGFYLVFVYSVSYMKGIDKLDGSLAFEINSFNMALLLLVLPAGAWLSDRWGRKPLLAAGLLILAVGALPAFILIHSQDWRAVTLGQFILASGVGLLAGSVCVTNVEMLPRHNRCTGVALSYNLAVGVFGGTAPLMAAWMITAGGNPIAPGYYLLAVALLGLATLFFVKESAHRPLP
tara:strand:- start:1934 stop:3355 length:1422 start_codon:yes stop_codon:yes gene_type:complete